MYVDGYGAFFFFFFSLLLLFHIVFFKLVVCLCFRFDASLESVFTHYLLFVNAYVHTDKEIVGISSDLALYGIILLCYVTHRIMSMIKVAGHEKKRIFVLLHFSVQ